jgi:hypothetical protein
MMPQQVAERRYPGTVPGVSSSIGSWQAVHTRIGVKMAHLTSHTPP